MTQGASKTNSDTRDTKSADTLWSRDEVQSPCTKICQIHPETQLCLGCSRSLAEIGAWSQMSNEARRIIMDALPDRRPAPTQRRGGRAARLKRQLNDDSQDL